MGTQRSDLLGSTSNLVVVIASWLLWSTPIFRPLIRPPPCHYTIQTHSQMTTTTKPISPTRIAATTTQWTTQTIVTYWPATSLAPCPCPLEHPSSGVLLDGVVPRAHPSREPTGRPRQSHGGHAALRARTSHSLWTWHPWRSYEDPVFSRVPYCTLGGIPYPTQQSCVPQALPVTHKSLFSTHMPTHQ